MKHIPLPAIKEIRSLFNYDRDSGKLYWKKPRCGVSIGVEAGNQREDGYRRVKINGRLYLAHRVIYAIAVGVDPCAMEIDHIDGNRLDNRVSNLRLASHSKNQANSPVYRNNTLQLRGVSWHKQHRKFVAAIQKNKKRYTLGLFHDKCAAAQAYDAAAIKLFGVFAKLNYPLLEKI